MRHLDKQMRYWSDRLIADLKISEEDAQKLATTIESEVRWLPKEAKDEIRKSSPIAIKHRYEELLSFQGWMDIANKLKDNPFIVRAQVIVQNYICFVYLNESCFNVVRKHVSNQSACKKCCKFLLNNPVRAFSPHIAQAPLEGPSGGAVAFSKRRCPSFGLWAGAVDALTAAKDSA